MVSTFETAVKLVKLQTVRMWEDILLSPSCQQSWTACSTGEWKRSWAFVWLFSTVRFKTSHRSALLEWRSATVVKGAWASKHARVVAPCYSSLFSAPGAALIHSSTPPRQRPPQNIIKMLTKGKGVISPFVDMIFEQTRNRSFLAPQQGINRPCLITFKT